MLIGPRLGQPRTGGPMDDQPSMLIEDARRRLREQDRSAYERPQIARRLVVAFILVALLALLAYVVLPQFGLHLPALIPPIAFLVITIGSLLSADAPAKADPPCDCDSDGRPICCSGPRPPRFTRGRRP